MTHPHKLEIARKERERRVAARAAFDIDTDALAQQMKSLPVFRDCPRPIRGTRVVIVYTAYATGGYAHGNRMVRIRVSSATKLEWLMMAMLHELVHAALPARVCHNERFRRTLARAAFEMWGISTDPNPKEANGRVARYGLDRILEASLKRLLETGLGYPQRAPVAEGDKELRQRERRARLVEKRSAHAARMLRKAARRLKIARTVERRWRTKVQRYERIAAKRGSS